LEKVMFPGMIQVEVIGNPIPQGSLVSNHRFGGLRYSNDVLLKEWRGRVINELAQAKPDKWDIHAALNVVAVFRFVRPKGHYGKKGLKPSAPKYKTTKPDVDKLTRGIGDSIEQAGIVKNDSQIIYWMVNKEYAEGDDPPGVSISIMPTNDQ
jgi:Holliday junction resolvase RusA-like endonuclease